MILACSRDTPRAPGLLAAVGLAVGLWGWSATGPSPDDTRCTGAREQLWEVWDDGVREDVRDAMKGTGAPHAESVWAWARTELDRYADQWVWMHTEACTATNVRGEQSPAMMDLRMGCLERARVGLGAVAEVLATADVELLSRVPELVQQLRPLSRCSDVAALQADVEPPRPDEAEVVLHVRTGLARVRASYEAGRYQTAEQRIAELEALVDDLEYVPVRMEVLLEKGRLLDALGRYEASEEVLRRVMRSASGRRQWDELREALRLLIHTMRYQRGRVDEALGYRDVLEGLASGDPSEEARIANTFAVVLQAQGSHAEAEAWLRQVLERQSRHLGSEHPALARTHVGLGAALEGQGHYAEAEGELRLALAIYERALGAEHPDVVDTRHQLAMCLYRLSRYDEAASEFRRVVQLQERLLGTEHPTVASSRNSLADVLNRQSKRAEAEEESRRALAILERVLGPDHVDTANAYNSLANVLSVQGRNAEAEGYYRRALAIVERVLGPEHPKTLMTWTNLAMALALQGRDEDALVELQRVLAVAERGLGVDHVNTTRIRSTLGSTLARLERYDEAEVELRHVLESLEIMLEPDHPMVAHAATDVARVLLARGDPTEAVPLAERGWAYFLGVVEEEAPVEDRAIAAFTLARALWEANRSGDARRRARSLAEQAQSWFARAPADRAAELEEVEEWLRRHR